MDCFPFLILFGTVATSQRGIKSAVQVASFVSIGAQIRTQTRLT